MLRQRRGGYDQAQVTAYVGGLIHEMESARTKVGELTRLVEKLQAENNTYKQKSGSRYGGLGERIDQMLLLAENEAAEVRPGGDVEAERLKAEVEKWAESLWEDSKRQAEGMRTDAERDALATRSEAQAYFEAQRTNAAKVAAELEATIAARREQAEQENGEPPIGGEPSGRRRRGARRSGPCGRRTSSLGDRACLQQAAGGR